MLEEPCQTFNTELSQEGSITFIFIYFFTSAIHLYCCNKLIPLGCSVYFGPIASSIAQLACIVM